MVVIRQENVWETWSGCQKSDLIHDYVMRYYDRNNRRKDYGTGELYTSVEAHVLEKIYLTPGITVTELAKRTDRTKGAISQIVKKLEAKELVTKTAQENHGKKQSLWATAKGKKLSKLHMNYDNERTTEFFGEIAKYFTSEQLDAFFKIMEVNLLLMRPESGFEWIND